MSIHDKTREETFYNVPIKKGKALDIYMRNQNRMYTTSFSMIDRKAAIMIRVNAIIISAIVIFFDSVQDLEYGFVIGIIMVVCCFFSLLFALNASRPKTFRLFERMRKEIEGKYGKLEEHIFCVGFNHHLTLDEYERAYDKITRNQEYQLGNQVRTTYLFEKLIKRAFKNVEISYIIFIIGFALTVLMFLVENLIEKL